MKSDPKECLYCQNNETLHNLMIEIAQLSVSRVFLFKEQTYRGGKKLQCFEKAAVQRLYDDAQRRVVEKHGIDLTL